MRHLGKRLTVVCTGLILSITLWEYPVRAGEFGDPRSQAIEAAGFASTLVTLGYDQAQSGNAAASCYWYGRAVGVLYYSFVFAGMHFEANGGVDDARQGHLQSVMTNASEPNYQDICELTDADPDTLKSKLSELKGGLDSAKATVSKFVEFLKEN